MVPTLDFLDPPDAIILHVEKNGKMQPRLVPKGVLLG